jgi:hypothetical protein
MSELRPRLLTPRLLLPRVDPYRAQRVALFNAIESRMNGGASSLIDTVNGDVWSASNAFHYGDRMAFGSGGYIARSHDSAMTIGTGDFQIDVVADVTSYSNFPTLVSKYQNSSTGLSLGVTNSGYPYFCCTGDGINLTATSTISTGAPTKMTIRRIGTTLASFVDDVAAGTTTNSDSIDGTAILALGCIPGISVTTLNGYILAFRMIVGSAVLFGPLDAPFPR